MGWSEDVVYPLVICYIANWNMAIEIVSFPMKNRTIFPQMAICDSGTMVRNHQCWCLAESHMAKVRTYKRVVQKSGA